MIEAGKLLQQRYRIDKQIGQGGMGAVYVATDERFGSTVAIKETLCMDDSYRRAIEREARLLNSLKHTALPRVTDHFVEDNGQFLVMEYIPGEDLFCTLEAENKPFPVGQVLTWADQLLNALDFLHNLENPVIHRDIKPQNLKVTSHGQIVLLDFGLAKGNPTGAGSQTASKSIFGYSRNYASLEQIQGTGTDPRSDLYSLAATLYHLLTNVPPDDALTRAMAVLSQQPDPLVPANRIRAEIPAGVAGILHRALDLNAAGRPASAAAMRDMLREHEKFDAPFTAAFVSTPVTTDIHGQKTQILPGATINAAERLTDIRTEVLPNYASQVTAVRNIAPIAATDGSNARAANSGGGPMLKKRALAAAASLLLIGSVGAGFYMYRYSNAEEQPANLPQPAIQQSATDIPQAEPGADVAGSAETSASESSPEKAETKAVETLKQEKPRTKTKSKAADGDEEIVIGDDETVYVGNMKIQRGRVETPDRIIDENGITPRTPRQPAPPVLPPNFQDLPPERRRRIIERIRKRARSGVRPVPQP